MTTPTVGPVTYGAVLRHPYVLRLLAGTLVGRLPNTMAPIAILLHITAGGGTLAFGGLLGALYVLASALSQPVKGRLLARYGQTRISGAAVVINASGLLALAVGHSAPATFATTCVLVAGACTPPLEAGLRALWATVIARPAERRAALALDTGTQGFLHIAGPMLVAAIASVWGSACALTATAALGLAGAAVVLTSAPSLAWRARTGNSSEPCSPLRHRGLRVLFLTLAATGFAVGALQVWAVTLADDHDMDLLSGLMPAVFSTGSFIGAYVFGRRTWAASTASQLALFTVGFAVCWIPVFATTGPAAATALTAWPGAFFPLVVASAFLLAEQLAPQMVTTAYAWLILSLGVGSAAGTALAGTLAHHPLGGPVLPLAGAAAALSVVLAARDRLTRHAPESP
ncbi:MFS transporter [Streptomyces sp. NPDC002867]